MDQALIKKPKKNPRENASIFSILFLTFTIDTFRKGLKEELSVEDVYDCLSSLRAKKLGDKLENAWNMEKNNPNPWILRSIVKVFGWEWAAYGAIQFICDTLLLILRPLIVGKVVSYFSKGQTEMLKETAYMYTALLILSIVVYTVYIHAFIIFIFQIVMKIRISCSSLIYRKALKLNSGALKKMTHGKVVTLLTKDVHTFDISVMLLHNLWIGVVHTGILSYIMYLQVGVPALIGVGILILAIPVHGLIGKVLAYFRLKLIAKTDRRVRITQEILTAIRIIKMYTWERFFTNEVNKARNLEIRYLRILYNTKAVSVSIGVLSYRIGLYVSLITYLAMGYHLTAEKAYVIVGSFEALRIFLTTLLPFGISQIAEATASIDRITEFLSCDEVIQHQTEIIPQPVANPQIILKSVCVMSDSETAILKNLNLEIKTGLTAITGPVGCGKSTLLKLLLKDTPVKEGIVTVDGIVSYATQQPWIFPSTIKQNILFGESLDEARYQNVVQVCALHKDFDTFSYGDATNVTDKGLNLSTGQKARISLARAIYKDVDIYLLDNCLTAVDVHVGKYIFRECIQGFLKNKLCVMVTHQQQFLKGIDDIIVMKEGAVQYRGNYTNINQWSGIDLAEDSVAISYDGQNVIYSDNCGHDDVNIDETSKLLEDAKSSAKPKSVYEESKQKGVVDRQVYKDYMNYGGGLASALIVAAMFILGQVTVTWFDYFVSDWVDLEETLLVNTLNGTTNSIEYEQAEYKQSKVPQKMAVIIIVGSSFIIIKSFAIFLFSTKASMNLHNDMLNKVINAIMTFYDINMSGNILNRFSRDIGIIDEFLPYMIFECARMTLILCAVLYVVSSANWIFLIPSALLAILLYYGRKYYLRIGRTLKRVEGATRSPVIGHVNASMEGLTTIRASKAQNILMDEFDKHLDTYNSTIFMQLTSGEAFGLTLDSVCAVYVSAIIVAFVTFNEGTGGTVGMVITQTLGLTAILQYTVRQWAELENQMTAVERVVEYTKIESEDKTGTKPEKWPIIGKIQFSAVSLQYAKTGERVLEGINFTVEPNEKIGVVGRTGAGKSSIISVLFKLYTFNGSILVDGVDINTVNMDWLRSHISIIPQDPVLFFDTLRNNLDPNHECTDKTLWDALEEVEMKKLVASLDSGLDSCVSEGGSNFSIGQRQLLCLTRAIIRKNKILVLDEATANIDPQTDFLIQRVIKKNFVNCTVITVAHRLHTILESDKVLVMDSGRMVEFDDPKELLKNTNGVFYGLIRQSGLLL